MRLSQRDLLILMVACLAIAAVAMVFAIRPASRPNDTRPGGGFVGRWSVSDPTFSPYDEIDISRIGSEFLLTLPGTTSGPHFRLVDGKLHAVGGTAVISQVNGHVVLTYPGATAGAPRVVETLKPVPASAATPTPVAPGGDQSADQDQQIVDGVHVIQIAVQSWAIDHQDTYPPVDLVVPGGSVARYAQQWPTNPCIGQPMTPGYGAGQYEYTVQGNQFSITGYGVNGTPILTVP